MNATVGRVGLAIALSLGVAGAALAREAAHDRAMPGKGFAGKAFAMPAYEARARMSGPERPYTWPVSDRYRPVSQPFYGRAY